MSESIEGGAGQTLTAQYFSPVFKGQIGRDDQAVPLFRS
jgi:hypothetical protein